jgi:DNA-binding IclR family transcriptional regulator
MNDSVKSAVRVLEMLELFSVADKPIGVSEIARRLTLPKSSTQALLKTLLARGYLVSSEIGYQLSPLVGSGGWIGGTVARLGQLAEPLMQRAAERSGETVFLGVLTSGWRVQYVRKVVSRNEVRYDADLDYLRPAHCTSLGLAIVAHRPAADIEQFLSRGAFERVTSKTITDPAALRRALQKALRDGYAEVHDTWTSGASGVSAPVFDSDGQAVAGLNLAAPSWRYSKVRTMLIKNAVSSARELTQALAGIVPAATAKGAAVPLRVVRGAR